jgi:hypothetical protein
VNPIEKELKVENSTIPTQVLYNIQYSEGCGQFDLDGKKYVFFPDSIQGGVNHSHVFNLGNKIGKMEAEGKISLSKMTSLHQAPHRGKLKVLIYSIASRKQP